MTEPVAAMTTHRAPDREVRGLPMPKAPPEAHLAKLQRRSGVVVPVWLCMVSGFIAFGSDAAPAKVAFGAAGLALVVGGIWFNIARQKRFNTKNTQAIAMLNAGKLDDARIAFDELARKAPTELHQAIAVYNSAATSLRTTDIERTLSLYAAVWRTKRLAKRGAALQYGIPFQISMLYAQLGDVTAAERWLEEGRKAKPPPMPTSFDVLAEVWLRARKHDFAGAAAHFDENWRAIEGTTQANMTRIHRLFRAFVAQKASRPGTQVDELVAGCRPFEKGEYDALTVGWPELRAFVVERGFAT